MHDFSVVIISLKCEDKLGKGPSINDVSSEGEGGGPPKADERR